MASPEDEINPDCSHTTAILPRRMKSSNQPHHLPEEEHFINLQNENSEHNLYPTNTFIPPTHVPGRQFNTSPHSLYQPSGPDYSKWDIVKIHFFYHIASYVLVLFVAIFTKASQFGYLDRVKEIVEKEGADVRKPDAENVTILHWASINNRIELVQYIISKGAIVDQLGGTLNSTALHWAIRQGLLDMTILLMKYGADPTMQDSEGCNGLHLAAQFGHSSIVAYLISKGTDVDTQDANGMTPLMWAAYRSFGVDPLRLILTMGASVNYIDTVHKNTALHWAITSSNTNAIVPLLKVGASLEAVNKHGQIPYELATERRNNYTMSHLQKEALRRGIGRPDFIKSINTDPDIRRRVTTIFPFFPMFAIGMILQYSPWWVYTIFMMTILFGFLQGFMSYFYDPRHNSVALGLYLATKSYMFSSLFFYFWPLLDSFYYHFFFWTNSTLLFYFFWQSWNMDPGIIKISQSQQKKQIIEMAESRLLNDFSKFCTTCLVRKPIRSKHCAICDKCVARMDHHCPWIDNCVGYKNHAYFVGFLFFLFFINLWYIWASIKYFNEYCQPFEDGIILSSIRAFQCEPWISWGFVMACFHACWVGALFSCNLYQVVWLGMTTNERMNAQRYKHFHSDNGDIKSPFSSGVLQNAADFFNFSFFGLRRPRNIDWMNEYDTRNYRGPQHNWRRYANI